VGQGTSRMHYDLPIATGGVLAEWLWLWLLWFVAKRPQSRDYHTYLNKVFVITRQASLV
jgi:hypothetical protein